MHYVSDTRAAVRARSKLFKKREDKAIALIERMLLIAPNTVVSCSFGKDSSVMLHLCQRVNPSITAVCVVFDETTYIDNYKEIWSWWGSNTDVHIERLMPTGVGLEDNYEDHKDIHAYMKRNSIDMSFVGIRAEENKWRERTLRINGKVFKDKAGFTSIRPLAWWSSIDIEAYCYKYQLPLLDSYKLGIEQRTATGIAPDTSNLRQSDMRRLKQVDISRYNALLKKYPQLKKYT